MATPLDSPIRALPDNGPVDLDNDRMVIEQDETAQIPPRAFLQKAFDTLLSGFSPGANQPVQSGDSLFIALQKLQAQINALVNGAANEATIITVDGAWNTLQTFDYATDPAITLLLQATVTARCGMGPAGVVGDGAAFVLSQAYAKQGGIMVEIGDGVKQVYPNGDETWDAKLEASADKILVRVKGSSDAYISWKVKWQITKI